MVEYGPDQVNTVVTRIAQWMLSHLRIRDKRGEVVPFALRVEQIRLLRVIVEQWSRGCPARVIILKARQLGFSTLMEGLLFMDALVRPNRSQLVVAHRVDSSVHLFGMTKLMHECIPHDYRRETDYSSRREIVWSPPHRSRITVATAGTQEMGRSLTLSGAHLSEVAFWPHASQAMLGVMQAVSDEDKMSLVGIESTANGVGGEFHSRWNSALERVRDTPGDWKGFRPHFASWLSCEDYQLDGDDLGYLDDTEEQLRKLGASDSSLRWRRYAVEALCGGDPLQFQQEYPATPSEAFVASGRPAIPPAVLAYHRETVTQGQRVLLKRSGDRVYTEPWPGHGSYWEIFDPPNDWSDYAIGSDVMTGKLSDTDDESSEPDYSAIGVLNRQELSTAAEWHGRIDPDVLADEMVKAALFYRKAWAANEINEAGWATLSALRKDGYPRIMVRDGPMDRIEDQPLGKLGWKTSPQTRDYMIDEWIAACRPDPYTGFEGKIVSRSSRLLDEESTFAYDKNGKRQHRSSCHDDVLFAWMIAYQVHLICPRGSRGMAPTLGIRRNRTKRNSLWQLARVGTSDPGPRKLSG